MMRAGMFILAVALLLPTALRAQDMVERLDALAGCVSFYRASADYEGEMRNSVAKSNYLAKVNTFTKSMNEVSGRIEGMTDKATYTREIIKSNYDLFSNHLRSGGPASVAALQMQAGSCDALNSGQQPANTSE